MNAATQCQRKSLKKSPRKSLTRFVKNMDILQDMGMVVAMEDMDMVEGGKEGRIMLLWNHKIRNYGIYLDLVQSLENVQYN